MGGAKKHSIKLIFDLGAHNSSFLIAPSVLRDANFASFRVYCDLSECEKSHCTEWYKRNWRINKNNTRFHDRKVAFHLQNARETVRKKGEALVRHLQFITVLKVCDQNRGIASLYTSRSDARVHFRRVPSNVWPSVCQTQTILWMAVAACWPATELMLMTCRQRQ